MSKRKLFSGWEPDISKIVFFWDTLLSNCSVNDVLVEATPLLDEPLFQD